MEQYTVNTPNGLGHLVPTFSSPMEEVILEEVARYQAAFICENSCLPKEGLDYKVVPPLPDIQDSVFLRTIKDLLDMDYETRREEVPGRVAAPYIALTKILDMAREREDSDPFAREVAGIAAAAFCETQNGRPNRKRARVDMLEESMRREARRNDAIIRAHTAIQDGKNRMMGAKTALMHVEGILGKAVADINGEVA